MSHFNVSNISEISDLELIAGFRDAVIEEREMLSLQLEYIAELDRRKLFFHYSSLRFFLVEEYGMEEWNAERKIRAARLLKRFPEVKEKLQSGKLNLTLLELAMGCAHREKLTDPELSEVLSAISGMSTRAAMREIASRYPLTYELPKDRIRPLTADHSEVRFVASHDLLEKLEEIRGLLAHAHPEGLSMGELIDVLATEYRERHHPEEKAKRAEARQERKDAKQTEKIEMTTAPQLEDATSVSIQVGSDQSAPTAQRVLLVLNEQIVSVSSQSIMKTPKITKSAEKNARTANSTLTHQLINKEGYRCSFVDDVTGIRCVSKYKLEIDHIKAWSHGGNTVLSNLRFLCNDHHRRVSFLQFGESSKYFKQKQEKVF